jgi:hypothetical protein
MVEKSSKMSTREAMIVLAGRPPAYGELPRWLDKIAKATGISFRTARSLWNEEISDPEHLAAKAVRQQAQIEEARRDAKVVANFFNSRAQALANVDEDFHRNEIDAFLAAARAIGGRDST